MLETLINTISDFAKDELKRNERVIKLLKQFNLDPDHPPAEFSGVYNYALVEYGVGKSLAILQLFREEDIQKAFRKAFDADNPNIVIEEVEKILEPDEWNLLQVAIAEDEIDVLHELAEFSAVFLKVVELSRTPAEVKRDRNIASLQQELQVIKQQLLELSTLGEIRSELAKLTAQNQPLLKDDSQQECFAENLALQLRGWFETLGYQFESYQVWEADYFEWIIKIQGRRRFDRILVRGIDGEAEIGDLAALAQSVEAQKTDEGWLVAARRVSRAARDEVNKDANESLFCYTLDEIIDETADFTNYINWLEDEVKKRKVDELYVALACTKEEFNPVTKQKMGVSRYDEQDGWIDGYVDLWVDDPAKEHLSILGEFGTGKTWFTFHYAWNALLKYKQAKQRGLTRPRLPLVILLRDYAKALDVENVMAGFFFSQHEISLNISVFEQLNRMGKLLLIFDGFDEMAARVDKQQMVNNFWELAKVVVPGAKVILTCRTEHFPEAKQGRSLLNAELRASVASLTAESPQFEVLELEKFSDEQIRQVLSNAANSDTTEKVMSNPQLLDLARRPVMSDLILEALPEIEAGKPVDMSRVYLYAVRRKMERDIKSERTFTSLVDKMYFLCELAWEMLSTNQMSLNYRLFPDRIRKLFGSAVEEQKDLDHWQYDMLGQTMLIRNADGDYTPAHRSLLEFFVAYKFAGELGVLADDFLEVVRKRSVDERETLALGFSSSEETLALGFSQTESFSQDSSETKSQTQEFSSSEETLALGFSQTESFSQDSSETKSQTQEFSSSEETLALGFSQTEPFSQDSSETESQTQEFSSSEETLALGFSWGEYFQNHVDEKGKTLALGKREETLALEKLKSFKSESLEKLRETVGRSPLTKAVLDLLVGMVDKGSGVEKLLGVIEQTKGKSEAQVGYVGGNAATILVKVDKTSLEEKDLSGVVVKGGDFRDASLRGVNFAGANLSDCIFPKAFGVVFTVSYSPDGKYFATGDANSEVILWRVSDNQPISIFKGHKGWVRSVVFTPDGNKLVSGSFDHTIIIWDIATGKCFKTCKGHSSRIHSVALSSDGKTIASASSDQNVKLWNIETGECFKTFQGHTNSVRGVSISPNDKTLASVSHDKSLKLWNIATGKCLKTLKGHTDKVITVGFSPDYKIVGTGSQDCTVKLWDVNTGECLKTLQCHTDWVRSIAFNSDGKILASASYDTTAKLWDVATGECLKILEGHTNWIRAVAFSPDDTILITAGDDQTIRQWNVLSGECIAISQGCPSLIRSITISPDIRTLISSSEDQTIKLWDINTGKLLKSLQGHTSRVNSVALSPDGKTIASVSYDKTLKLWNINTGECSNTLYGHSLPINAVAFAADGNTIATGGGSRSELKLWDFSTGEYLNTLYGHKDWVWSLSFSSDGKILASGSNDQSVRIWNVNTGECVKTLEWNNQGVKTLAFSCDREADAQRAYRNILAIGCSDSKIYLWDIDAEDYFEILEAHTDSVFSVVFSPDGKILASGSNDETVKLWDIQTKECFKTFKWDNDGVSDVAISSDGKILAAGSWNGTIKIWNIQTGECIKTLSNKPYANMNITNATGLTSEQKSSLKALGAVEDHSAFRLNS